MLQSISVLHLIKCKSRIIITVNMFHRNAASYVSVRASIKWVIAKWGNFENTIFNKWFARDCSKKIRAVFQSKGKSGEILCSIPPYGYIRDPEDKRHWLVDEAAAEVVRKIFELYLGGMGTKMIADFLEENGILTPTDHLKSLGKKPRGTYWNTPVKWTCTTVNKILSRQEYTGDIVNFKTTMKSYKIHKKIEIPAEERTVLKGVNEPISYVRWLGKGTDNSCEK